MKMRRILLLVTFMLFLIGSLGGTQVSAKPTPNTDLSEECKAEIKAVLQNCSTACGKDFRCFLRCIINSYPACLQ